MCFFEIDKELDNDFISRKNFIHDNRNQYNSIKIFVKTINVYDSIKFSVNLVFEKLFSIYNIANVFDKYILKNYIIRIIDDKVITNNKLCLLLKEYIRIYEDFIIDELL